jgi:hypothetical protein
MLEFQIVINTLKITDGSETVFSISKKDVYYIQTSLNEDIPKISLYNVNVGVFAVVFQALLSDCLDSNGNPFTVNSFTDFAEINLGFNSGGASSSITVTDSYATLPNPTTVSGQFFWCENADGTFPVGLYYSDGTTWQFQVADDITVVANYSALPNPTTVNGQFFWAEASQGTSWLPNNVGGNYYSAGMYYSNGVSWSFLDVPYQATQDEVNTGTNTNKFVTPSTLKNQNYLALLESPVFTGTPSAPTQTANDNSTNLSTTAYADAKVTDAITDGVTSIAPSQNAVFDALALKQNLLVYTPYRFISALSNVTGTIAETVVAFATLPVGTFNANDSISFFSRFLKVASLSAMTLRVRTSPNNVPLSATQIAIYTFTTTNTFATFTRNFTLNSGSLLGYNFSSSIANDVTPTNTAGNSTAFNPSVINYFYLTVQLGNISDVVQCNQCKLSN